MSYAYVLPVEDRIAGPRLELLRRIAQPRSRSEPHLTVRYPVTNPLELTEYAATSVERVELVSAGAFPLPREEPNSLHPRTIYITCESEELDALVYKPDFPDSVFHITLYDGSPSEFSRELLRVAQSFEWQRQLEFTVGRQLKLIPIGRDAEGMKLPRGHLSAGARAVGDELFGGDWAPHLPNWSDSERLGAFRAVCSDLHQLLPVHERKSDAGRPQRLKPRVTTSQEQLWVDPTSKANPPVASAKLRNAEQSLFLTPPEIARQMISLGLRLHGLDKPLHFGDPALGNSIFFASLLRQVDQSGISSAIGVELDEERAAVAAAKWASRGLKVQVGNFLSAALDADRSLVVANPPYRRFQKLDSGETSAWRKSIASTLGISVDGRADLYVYFLLMSHGWLCDDAVSVWLLPGEFLQTRYGAAVRDFLTRSVTMVRFHSYDSEVSRFENARVSSVVVGFRKRPPSKSSTVEVSVGGSIEHPHQTRRVLVSELRHQPKWDLAGTVRVPDAAHRGAAGERTFDGVRLGDWFEVRRGIATGANRWFVLTDDRRKELEVKRRWVRPLVPRPRALASDEIEATKDGLPKVAGRTWLIDTAEPLDLIREESPPFAQYLADAWEDVKEGTLVRQRTPFYSQEKRDAAPFLFCIMASSESKTRRSRFILNRSVAVGLNHYIHLYPRGNIASALHTGALSLDAVFEVLRSVGSGDLSKEGRRYVGGLEKVEPGELKNVRLRPTKKLLRLVNDPESSLPPLPERKSK